MIAKFKLPLLVGGTLLSGCAPQPQTVYYTPYPQPVYQATPQAYYPTPYAARPVPPLRHYAPQPEPAQPAPEKTDPEPARQETAPPPPVSSPRATARDCVGWWRICHFL
jgi:hypothetical protein